jgi:hypothetical protein
MSNLTRRELSVMIDSIRSKPSFLSEDRETRVFASTVLNELADAIINNEKGL